MFFKPSSIFFWWTKYGIFCEHVAYYLHSILWRRGRLWLGLFASTVSRFLSQVSYLPSYVFLRRRRSFTSSKLYVCLCFFTAIWSSLCYSSFGVVLEEGRTGVFSWCVISWFYFPWNVNLVNYSSEPRDLKVLRDPWKTWIINWYSWFYHSIRMVRSSRLCRVT